MICYHFLPSYGNQKKAAYCGDPNELIVGSYGGGVTGLSFEIHDSRSDATIRIIEAGNKRYTVEASQQSVGCLALEERSKWVFRRRGADEMIPIKPVFRNGFLFFKRLWLETEDGHFRYDYNAGKVVCDESLGSVFAIAVGFFFNEAVDRGKVRC